MMNAAMPEKTKIWVEIKSAVPYINKWALLKPKLINQITNLALLYSKIAKQSGPGSTGVTF